jgi:simple sugar transport system ATP-binding protein
MPTTLQLVNITKRFPGVLANDAVSLTVAPGEIHALLGENGAGKSTLMQILYGFHQMDSGEILLDNAPVRITTPADAIALGIGMVHQDFMLVPTFTVAENTILGLKSIPIQNPSVPPGPGDGASSPKELPSPGDGPSSPKELPSPGDTLVSRGFSLGSHTPPKKKWGFSPSRMQQAAARIRSLSAQHHLAVDPHALTGTLPIGVQQRVEILKLLYRDARILILDEPTAVLTPPEKDRLFTVLRGLRAEGRSIILVTHKLHEILDLADRVTVMRDGRVLTTLATAEASAPTLARLMVGRDVNLTATKPPLTPGPAILRVQNLNVRDHTLHLRVDNLSLTLHPHEILGIAGVDGNGQSHLAEALLNLRPIQSGQILLNNQDITHQTPSQHRQAGIAYIPADRRNIGSVAPLSIADNAILTHPRAYTRRALLNRSAIRAHAQTLTTRFGVRPASIDTPASNLSGGNLQKVILGRELMAQNNEAPKVLIVEQPTRGLDVGAIESIWAELLRARASGTAILLISAELEELLNLSDRIAVMVAGRIAGIVDPTTVTLEHLGLLMAGTPQPADSSNPTEAAA